MSPLPPDVPKENIQLDLDQPHMEIIDTAEGKVFQPMNGVTRAEYDAIDAQPPYVKVGIGLGAMDEGGFLRSPGAEVDGPMEVRALYGHSWSFCARPLGAPELPAGPDGPRRILVDKHHVVAYRAGPELGTLVLPDGSEYVHVIRGSAPLALPDGWKLRAERLEHDVTIRLATPTTVFFFPNGDSYQGPV